MARALRLAALGADTTHPNPRVGCIIVKADKVVAEAWHRRTGEPHAEVLALRAAGSAAHGATVYLNLEPCCHQGRTPPCTDSLIDAGVARVVAAMEDPNPQVAGGGVEVLRGAGIDVDVGILGEQAEALNRGFVKRMRTGAPWVTVKVAASLDGRTAMASGESKWITARAARDDVQRLRARSSAVMTGIGTVLADDPRLDVRLPGAERQPLRVVVDSQLRISTEARVLHGEGTALVATANSEYQASARLTQLGVEVVPVPAPSGRVDLSVLMQELGQREINELLVEAGPTLSGAMLQSGLVDEVIVYLAPHLMGDAARGMFHLPGVERITERFAVSIADMRQVGNDLRLRLELQSGPFHLPED